jgi:hypothetical protein
LCLLPHLPNKRDGKCPIMRYNSRGRRTACTAIVHLLYPLTRPLNFPLCFAIIYPEGLRWYEIPEGWISWGGVEAGCARFMRGSRWLACGGFCWQSVRSLINASYLDLSRMSVRVALAQALARSTLQPSHKNCFAGYSPTCGGLNRPASGAIGKQLVTRAPIWRDSRLIDLGPAPSSSTTRLCLGA